MRLHHVTILTDDVEGTTAFYREVIGLTPGPRPDFPFEGAWLYEGSDPVVHLKCPAVARGTGGVEHVAFHTDRFDEVAAQVLQGGHRHELVGLPDGSLRQCFLHDPNGVLVEITGR